MIMKNKLFLLILLSAIKLNAQTVSYKFVPLDTLKLDTVTYVINGKIDTFIIDPNKIFEYKRISYYDGTFKEFGLLTDDSASNRDIFKRKGNVWYYKHKKIWKIFFSPLSNKSEPLFFGKDKFIIKWKKIGSWQNISDVYLISKEPCGFAISHNAKYYFSPTLGIIGIDGTGPILIRSDLKKGRIQN